MFRAYTYKYLHAYIHTYLRKSYVHTDMQTYIHTHIPIQPPHAHTHTYIHTYINTQTYACVIHTYVCLSISVCADVWISPPAHSHVFVLICFCHRWLRFVAIVNLRRYLGGPSEALIGQPGARTLIASIQLDTMCCASIIHQSSCFRKITELTVFSLPPRSAANAAMICNLYLLR